MEAEKRIRQILIQQGEKILLQESKRRLSLQGHKLTGKLESSLRIESKIQAKALELVLFSAKYGTYVNKGVPASSIPFGGNRRSGRRGGRSKYIQGLITYFRRRGVSSLKEATGAAFATAKIHKKTGMPTPGSRRFSRTGKRTGAFDSALKISVDVVLKKTIKRIAQTVAKDFVKDVNKIFA